MSGCPLSLQVQTSTMPRYSLQPGSNTSRPPVPPQVQNVIARAMSYEWTYDCDKSDQARMFHSTLVDDKYVVYRSMHTRAGGLFEFSYVDLNVKNNQDDFVEVVVTFQQVEGIKSSYVQQVRAARALGAYTRNCAHFRHEC